MQDPTKYVIRATVTASGVIEPSDVVGAVFGQTEGLLGEQLDLRSLQEREQVGRIDVDITSEHGSSTGTISIATDLDRVRTAVLAAALETIERVGPCRASIEVDQVEDVRAAKRRYIVDRASELVRGGFEEMGVPSGDLVTAVHEETRPAAIDAYAGYPAGPEIETSDEIIVVEGRADVLRLLEYDITNVVGVEGTDVPDEIADLTRERDVTAFFDGDRGGNLLLLELAQIGDVDFVTFAPPGRSVEDLSLVEVREALAEKVRYEDVSQEEDERHPEPADPSGDPNRASPPVLDHIEDVISQESDTLRVLAPDWEALADAPAEALDETLASIEDGIGAVVIDDIVEQRHADIAARYDVALLIGSERGEFTKQPIDVRVLSAERVLERPPAPEHVSS